MRTQDGEPVPACYWPYELDASPSSNHPTPPVPSPSTHAQAASTAHGQAMLANMQRIIRFHGHPRVWASGCHLP